MVVRRTVGEKVGGGLVATDGSWAKRAREAAATDVGAGVAGVTFDEAGTPINKIVVGGQGAREANCPKGGSLGS